MSIIAISSEGPDLKDSVDPRFGRAAGFIIYNTDTKENKYIDNGAAQASPRGAGIQAAELVANAGAELILTGVVGPKAKDALNQAGVKSGEGLEGKTVEEAIALYTAGELKIS